MPVSWSGGQLKGRTMESLGDILKRLTPRNTYDGTDISPAEEEAETEECPRCGGRGWVRADVPVGHSSFGKAVPCTCQAQDTEAQQLARFQRYSNLGALTRLTFQTLDRGGRSSEPQAQRRFQEAYQAGVEYAEDPQGWLALTGPVGSGKTHLLAAIVNRCLELGVPAFYISVPDLLDHLRSTYAPSSEVTYDDLFDHVRNAPVLALDDLGAHATTPWAQEKLNQILNHRFNRQLPTVVSLSVPLGQLEEPLRARLEDREQVMIVALGEHVSSSRPYPDKLELELIRRMTFEAFDTRGNGADATAQDTLESALNSARVFAQEPSGWLVFTGEPGCGKTHLAAAILNYRMRLGYHDGRLEFIPDLLDHLRSTFAPNSNVTYDQLFEEIRTAPLLVLDDLGAQSSTPWAEEKLYQIIVYRQETRLPTVITVRGFIEDVKLPESIKSRLKDVSLVEWLPITARDYRDSGKQQGSRGRSPWRAR